MINLTSAASLHAPGILNSAYGTSKAAKLVIDVLGSDVTGPFLWIDEPLQSPLRSWGEADAERPWTT